ncbi:MAG TPA: hypothetical protein DEQ40_02580 [Oxalobacteraceae bacterium]|jgi:hypothetical protein|nr:hypothetical protein [Oxalobacteraceae bacterium]
MADENVQRALGRIEGTQTQILDALNKLSDSFGEHKQEDQRNFSSVRHLVFTKLQENDESREKHLGEQDVKLDALKQDADRAKGAGWVILGLLGSLAAAVGAAVLSVFSGWVSVKFH